MQFDFSRDTKRLIDELVASGRYASAEDAVAQALRLLACRDRVQQERLEQLRRDINEGLHQVNRGEMVVADSVFEECRRGYDLVESAGVDGPLRLSLHAAGDLRAVCGSLAALAPRAAAALLEQLEETGRTLVQHPARNPPCDELVLGLRYVRVAGFLMFYRATVTGVDVVRILRDPWSVDTDSPSRDTAEPASLLDLAPTLGQLGLDELLEAPWVHVEPRKEETTRVYRVPRRFGVGALLVVTAFFCGMLGLLRLFGTPPPIMAYIGLQVVAAGVMQVIIRKSPRAASALAGAVLLPATVVFFAVLYEGAWEVIAATPCLAVAGFPLGYLAGGLIAGVFMVMEMADDRIARRTNRAAQTDSPHPLAEPADAEPPAEHDQDHRQSTSPDHDPIEQETKE